MDLIASYPDQISLVNSSLSDMSEMWKKLQKSLLGGGHSRGRGRRRCHEANPSQDRIASGMLPTEDELRAFEASYAGPQSAELMERHSGECVLRSESMMMLTLYSLVRRYC